jgi:hypothetical protein
MLLAIAILHIYKVIQSKTECSKHAFDCLSDKNLDAVSGQARQ